MVTNTAEIPQTAIVEKRSGIKKRYIFLILIALVLVISAGIYFWVNRPIKPVILAAAEQQQLNQKIEQVQERTYDKGAKIIELSEREINALFHHNTNLGDKIRLELATDAIHARIATDLDSDIPVVGGRKLKAKARFELTDENNNPAIILDDLTVWGVSLPNAWLAELKGENLLSNLGINPSKNELGKGIKTLKVQNGKVTIELAE